MHHHYMMGMLNETNSGDVGGANQQLAYPSVMKAGGGGCATPDPSQMMSQQQHQNKVANNLQENFLELVRSQNKCLKPFIEERADVTKSQ